MLDVLKPGRYINSEWNAVHKDWKDVKVKFALCFPDIYEIGMSHLGMRILYGLLNREKDVVCERVFAPWSDMEKKMRSEKTVLASLENDKGLNEFDIVGFSLQYEMNFVDVLNMLDMGGVPVFSKDRSEKDPLIIAGGPCAFNPLPMADFIDAFVIGEAEEVVLEIVDIIKETRDKRQATRDKRLREFAKIKGVYVPDHDGSRLCSQTRFRSSLEQYCGDTIKKRIIEDLDNSYFPTAPVVPYIQIVHDRIGIEIMRGCPHKCRFCQACKIFYPLRIRSVKRILEIAEESVKNTGYEEISLLSLSSGDYPYLEELSKKLEERFKGLGVKISLPSLRVRDFEKRDSKGILKKAGLTFAPEAGSDRLRRLLNKNIKNEDVIQKSNFLIESGWPKVKLYFMIGLPGETYEDLDGIIQIASQIKSANLSISPFIPKPHTDFEREGMDELAVLEEKIKYIGCRVKGGGWRRNIRTDFHDPKMSRIEAILSRGDREINKVIYRAWQRGARLQAWDEYFNYNIWNESFNDCGVGPEKYLGPKNDSGELAWDFIET